MMNRVGQPAKLLPTRDVPRDLFLSTFIPSLPYSLAPSFDALAYATSRPGAGLPTLSGCFARAGNGETTPLA